LGKADRSHRTHWRGQGHRVSASSNHEEVLMRCEDCGERLQSVVISTRWGRSTEICNVSEVNQIGPARCIDCLNRTAREVDAIVDRIGPLLLMDLWAASA
jgi:hypothetical protein